MISRVGAFGLSPAARNGAVLPGDARRIRCTFMDYTIDGEPLRNRLHNPDMISMLATDLPAQTITSEVQRLLLNAPAPLPDGRYVLYCCPECGDLGCGAITAGIERNDNHITWSGLGWQTDYDPEIDFQTFADTGPSHFHAPQCVTALTEVTRQHS